MEVQFFDIRRQFEPIQKDIEASLSDIFQSCSFIGGPYVAKFEKEMEDYLGAKHAVSCANGTDALMLALLSCGVEPGDEIITTSFSFFATAEAISAIGAIPVFVDVLPYSYVIDHELIEAAITNKTKAILPVHIFGACCNMDSIMQIARKHKLKVIEDCAQSIGSRYKGKKAGTLGDVGCFSFYPTKNLGGCGDGGMCVTNDEKIFTRLKAFREHGAGKNGYEASKSMRRSMNNTDTCLEDVDESATSFYDPYKYYNFLIGYNSRLDAIQAAVLSIKLKHIDEYNRKREKIADKYLGRLTHFVLLPWYPDNTEPCWHQFVIRTTHKKELCKYLSEHGVGVGTFYPVPLHKQIAFNKKNCGNYGVRLPEAEALSEETVCLPIYPELTDAEVEYVIETVNQFFEENRYEVLRQQHGRS